MVLVSTPYDTVIPASLQEWINDMATPSARKYLTENGFRCTKQANHGEIWEDGYSRIMVSRNAEAEHPGLKKDIRNALAKRNPKPIAEKPEMKPEPVPQQPQPQSNKGPRQLPLLIMTILTDPDLSSDQKVKMIMAYAELG